MKLAPPGTLDAKSALMRLSRIGPGHPRAGHRFLEEARRVSTSKGLDVTVRPTRNATSRSGTNGGVPGRRHRGPGAGHRTPGAGRRTPALPEAASRPREAEHRGRDTERRRFRCLTKAAAAAPRRRGRKRRGRDTERSGAGRRTPALPAPGEGVSWRGQRGAKVDDGSGC